MALPSQHYAILEYAVFSGGMTALLLSPGTGVRKPTGGRPATQYRRTAAAVDETAQINLTVFPFDPAVRDHAIALLRFGCCLRRSRLRGPARAFDVIVLTEQRCVPPFPASCSAGSLCVQSHAAANHTA